MTIQVKRTVGKREVTLILDEHGTHQLLNVLTMAGSLEPLPNEVAMLRGSLSGMLGYWADFA